MDKLKPLPEKIKKSQEFSLREDKLDLSKKELLKLYGEIVLTNVYAKSFTKSELINEIEKVYKAFRRSTIIRGTVDDYDWVQ